MPVTCWGCEIEIASDPDTSSEPVPVDFVRVTLCQECADAFHDARNNIRLPAWEAAHRRLAETQKGKP